LVIGRIAKYMRALRALSCGRVILLTGFAEIGVTNCRKSAREKESGKRVESWQLPLRKQVDSEAQN
jgi:hypothetical protein